jgi:hypothetical protein
VVAKRRARQGVHDELHQRMRLDDSTKQYLKDAKFNTLDSSCDVPVCVILHPDIREGISFEFSPKIVCIEMPYGVGNLEQINARVLRSVNTHKRQICFLDGTFRFQTNADNEGTATTHSIHVLRARPWRATKDVVHLVSNELQTRVHMPHWVKFLRKYNKKIPEFLEFPTRVADYIKNRVVLPNGDHELDHFHDDIAGLNIEELEANTIYSNLKTSYFDWLASSREEYVAQRRHDPVGDGLGYTGWFYKNYTGGKTLIRGDYDVYRYNQLCAEKMSELNRCFATDQVVIDHPSEYDCEPFTCNLWPPDQPPDKTNHRDAGDGTACTTTGGAPRRPRRSPPKTLHASPCTSPRILPRTIVVPRRMEGRR